MKQRNDTNEENEELFGDNKKYFGKDYYTAYIKIDENALDDKKTALSSDTNKITNLIALLTEAVHREVKEEVFKILKHESGLDLMLEAIKDPRTVAHKSTLVAACWEAGIDCSQHLSFFTDLAIHDTYLVSLEAITVIQNMEGPFDTKELATVKAAVVKALKNTPSDRYELIQDLKATLDSFEKQ